MKGADNQWNEDLREAPPREAGARSVSGTRLPLLKAPVVRQLRAPLVFSPPACSTNGGGSRNHHLDRHGRHR
jgi:hypothetical protein